MAVQFGDHDTMRQEIPGHRRSLARSRRNVCDLLYFASGKPACVQSRTINVRALAAVRDASPARIGWATLFMRSLAIVSTRWPILRQCHMRWPWSHLYEAEASVGMIAVSREITGEPWTFFGRVAPADHGSLESLEERINLFTTGPAEKTFRVQYGNSRLPLILRRARIWLAYHADPRRRVKHFGTFGLTTVSSRGSEIDVPPLLNSASFTYGPIDAAGDCRLTVAYDHRLIDGAPIAELLADVEQTLNVRVRAELVAIPRAGIKGDLPKPAALRPDPPTAAAASA